MVCDGDGVSTLYIVIRIGQVLKVWLLLYLIFFPSKVAEREICKKATKKICPRFLEITYVCCMCIFFFPIFRKIGQAIREGK